MRSQLTSYELKINGNTYKVGDVEPRMLLADVLRDVLGFTGTHLGCEHGVCGACTVLMDGMPVRSCLTLGVQAPGHEITTVEGLAPMRSNFRSCKRRSGRSMVCSVAFVPRGY